MGSETASSYPGSGTRSTRAFPAGLSASGTKARRSGRGVHPEVDFTMKEMQAIGIDYQIVFPTPMLALGMHPDPDIEVAMSWAYSRWLTEEILPHDPRIKTMVYLPFNDPEACVQAVE